jgi:hypothetical protein
MNQTLLDPNAPQGKFAAISAAFDRLTNQLSLLSLFILLLNASFLGAGLYLFARTASPSQDNSQVPFGFFLVSGILTIVYAVAYGLLCNNQKSDYKGHFDGGYVSARFILRTMTYMLAFSCAAVAYEIIGLHWISDPSSGNPYLCAIPVILIGFALTHGFYATGSKDMAGSSAWRWGTGRRALVLLTILTMTGFGYNVVYSIRTLIYSQILGSMALFTGAFVACIVTIFCYQDLVSVACDRGINEG